MDTQQQQLALRNLNDTTSAVRETQALVEKAERQLARATRSGTKANQDKWEATLVGMRATLASAEARKAAAQATYDALRSAEEVERRQYFVTLDRVVNTLFATRGIDIRPSHGYEAAYRLETIEVDANGMPVMKTGVDRNGASYEYMTYTGWSIDIHGPRDSYTRSQGRTLVPSTVNWGAYGSKSPADTRAYIALMQLAMNIAEFLDGYVEEHPYIGR